MDRPRAALAAVLLASLVFMPATAATVEGRWLLVEETYGAGGLNLVRNKPLETMKFIRESGGLVGRIRIGAAASEQRWPPTEAGKDVSFSPGENEVRARYLTPENVDRFRLDIVEEYRVSADGGSLTGTLTVTFLQEGEHRGSFVLHRTFKRQP